MCSAMNCREVENLLPDYLSDNLDGDSRSRVEGHLRQCDGCIRMLSGMRRMIAELGGLEKVSAPPDFLAKVRRKASSKRRRGWIFEMLFVPFRWKVPLQLTAMAALGVLIFFMIPYQRQGDESGVYLRQPPAPQVAMKKEMPSEVASPEGAFPESAPEVQPIAQDPELPSAEAPASSAIAERDEPQGTGAAISSQVVIPVVLRVASVEQVAKAQSRHAPAFGSPSGKPRKLSTRKLSKGGRLQAKSMALDEAKKDADSLAESEPSPEETEIAEIEKDEARTDKSLREGPLFKKKASKVSENGVEKERTVSEQFDSRMRLLLESFDAVEVRESEGPAGSRRLEIRLTSEYYQPFIDRLETLGVVETPPPPLPKPPPDSVVLDLILLFQ